MTGDILKAFFCCCKKERDVDPNLAMYNNNKTNNKNDNDYNDDNNDNNCTDVRNLPHRLYAHALLANKPIAIL